MANINKLVIIPRRDDLEPTVLDYSLKTLGEKINELVDAHNKEQVEQDVISEVIELLDAIKRHSGNQTISYLNSYKAINLLKGIK